jgi:hypothetical protein
MVVGLAIHLDVRRTKFKGIVLHCRNTETAWLRQKAHGPRAAALAKGTAKKKGRAGVAVRPKSREETPKVGTPWRAEPTTALTCIWACSCCAATSPRPSGANFGNNVAGRQRVICQMATLELW